VKRSSLTDGSTWGSAFETPGAWVPRLVVRREIEDVPNEAPMDGTVITYTLQSFDTDAVPGERFAWQHPPAGTDITDYRFLSAPSLPLVYRFSDRLPVDTESRLQFEAKQQALFRELREHPYAAPLP